MSKHNSRKHPAFSNKQLENLSLADLLEGIEPKALAQKASGGTEAKNVDLRTAERKAADEKREEEIRAAAIRRKLSPWKPECLVLVVIQTQCLCCKNIYKAPAAESILCRFRHSRNGSTWEVSNHPIQLNRELPREIKTLEREVWACQLCFESQAQDFWEQHGMFQDGEGPPDGPSLPSEEEPSQ